MKMEDNSLIIGGVALVVLAIAVVAVIKRRKQRTPNSEEVTSEELSLEELIDSLSTDSAPEKVEILKMEDVVTYFKSFPLKKGKDLPFIARKGHDVFLLGTYNEKVDQIEHYKLIKSEVLDEQLKSILGKEKFVVLS